MFSVAEWRPCPSLTPVDSAWPGPRVAAPPQWLGSCSTGVPGGSGGHVREEQAGQEFAARRVCGEWWQEEEEEEKQPRDCRVAGKQTSRSIQAISGGTLQGRRGLRCTTKHCFASCALRHAHPAHAREAEQRQHAITPTPQGLFYSDPQGEKDVSNHPAQHAASWLARPPACPQALTLRMKP